MELESASAEETESVGARVAADLHPGDLVTVAGELGSGKTTFVRGACRALGVVDRVTSPTFTVGHRYAGRVPVSHLDLFRFAGVSAAEWGDLEPFLDDGVWFVEWGVGGEGVLARGRFGSLAQPTSRQGLLQRATKSSRPRFSRRLSTTR